MTATLEATFDGTVLRPEAPLDLAPNTRVLITVETLPTPAADGSPRSFLQTARDLGLEGPPDWATRLDEHLYGEQEPR